MDSVLAAHRQGLVHTRHGHCISSSQTGSSSTLRGIVQCFSSSGRNEKGAFLGLFVRHSYFSRLYSIRLISAASCLVPLFYPTPTSPKKDRWEGSRQPTFTRFELPLSIYSEFMGHVYREILFSVCIFKGCDFENHIIYTEVYTGKAVCMFL